MFKKFTNGPENRSSIPGPVIRKTQKIVFDASLHDTQYHKIRTRVEWSNSGRSSDFSNLSVKKLLKKEPSGRLYNGRPTYNHTQDKHFAGDTVAYSILHHQNAFNDLFTSWTPVPLPSTMVLALDNLWSFICHNKKKPNHVYTIKETE